MLRKMSLVALAAVTLLASPAFAQESTTPTSPVAGMEGAGGLNDKSVHVRNSGISLMAYLPYIYGFGIGASGRYNLPIIHDGFIADLNDSFFIEIGADVGFGTYALSGGYVELSLVPVEGRWSLHFTPQLEAFAKVGIGYTLYLGNAFLGNQFYYNATLGVIYRLSDKFALRAEGGYHGLKGGIHFEF